jgi:hypothetical protein
MAKMIYGMLIVRNYPRQNKDCYLGLLPNKIKGLAMTATTLIRAFFSLFQGFGK